MKKTLFSLTIVVVTAIITLHYSCKREDPVFIKMYDLTINIDLSKELGNSSSVGDFLQADFCVDKNSPCKRVVEDYLNNSFQSVKGVAGTSVGANGVKISDLQFDPCVTDGDLAGCIVEVRQGSKKIVGTFDYSEKIGDKTNFTNGDVYKPIIKVSVAKEDGAKLSVFVNYKSKVITAYSKWLTDIQDMNFVYLAGGVNSFSFLTTQTEYPITVPVDYFSLYKNGCQNGDLIPYQ
jgi:hypothetical protein